MLQAQEDSLALARPDTLIVAQPDSLINADSTMQQSRFALEFSADYGKGLESLLAEQKKWEFGLGLILKNKLAFVGEYGSGKLLPKSVIQNGTYEVTGTYYRAGLEYMFTIIPKHQLALGAMFASSTYADFGTVEIISEFWPSVNEEFRRENLRAQWAEIILNTQGPVINANSGFLSNVYWGIRFRLRIMITDLDQEDFDIYAVPGFGKTYSQVVPAANFFLRYRLSF